MTADLVTRLRGWLDEDVPIGVVMNEAATRIEQLEALYDEAKQCWMQSVSQCAEAAARIAQLEAALHRISLGSQDSGTTKKDLGREARAALGGAND